MKDPKDLEEINKLKKKETELEKKLQAQSDQTKALKKEIELLRKQKRESNNKIAAGTPGIES